MANGAIHQLPTATPERVTEQEADLGTLLGLYHGYDQARIALARVVCEFGSEASSDEETRRKIWSRIKRQGVASDLFHPPHADPTPGVNRGAHAASLSAFATVSDQAEQLLRQIRDRWPELCEDAGGPLPAPSRAWDLD